MQSLCLDDLLTNPQTMDYKKLLLLLYESVLHHDFDKSGSIVEAITAWPFLGGEIPIKVFTYTDVLVRSRS